MNWSVWIRRTHRWLSIAFTAAVVINLVALAEKSQAVWVGLLALVPLILLTFTGLYMFVLPYARRRKMATAARPAIAPQRPSADAGA